MVSVTTVHALIGLSDGANLGTRVATGVNAGLEDLEAGQPDPGITSSSSEHQSNNEAANFGPLKHLGHYSVVSGSEDVQYDLSCLLPFREPNMPADLTHGLRGCLERNRNNTTLGHPVALDNILGTCIAFNSCAAVRNAHVVTWRGIITKCADGSLSVSRSSADTC